MNRLSSDDRARILHLLCEGSSIRAVVRLTGASKNTVAKLLVNAGKACAAYHDEHVRSVRAKRVQVNEIWSFTYAKQKNVPGTKVAPYGADDHWTWTAIDADTKLVLSYFIGGRDGECAAWFVEDLKARLATRMQLSSDGHKAYLEAVEDAFGTDVDYAQLVKLYGTPPGAQKGRYTPAECSGEVKHTIEGAPDPKHVSTFYVERQNLTMRMHMRRFTRHTNALSKKVEHHAYAAALHFMYHNFVRLHGKLRVSPAMAAGVTDRRWEIVDIVALIEMADVNSGKWGSYKQIKQEELCS